MIRFLLAALSWVGVANACPKLAGRYACSYKSGRPTGQNRRQDLTVTEAGEAPVAYAFNGSPMIADNVVRKLPDDGETRESTLRTWCDPGTDLLHAELKGRYYDGQSYGGELLLAFTYAREGDDLRQTTRGQLDGPGFSYPLDSDVVCTPD